MCSSTLDIQRHDSKYHFLKIWSVRITVDPPTNFHPNLALPNPTQQPALPYHMISQGGCGLTFASSDTC